MIQYKYLRNGIQRDQFVTPCNVALVFWVEVKPPAWEGDDWHSGTPAIAGLTGTKTLHRSFQQRVCTSPCSLVSVCVQVCDFNSEKTPTSDQLYPISILPKTAVPTHFAGRAGVAGERGEGRGPPHHWFSGEVSLIVSAWISLACHMKQTSSCFPVLFHIFTENTADNERSRPALTLRKTEWILSEGHVGLIKLFDSAREDIVISHESWGGDPRWRWPEVTPDEESRPRRSLKEMRKWTDWRFASTEVDRNLPVQKGYSFNNLCLKKY